MAPERFLLQVTIGRSTQDKLRYAQQLLGHALPSGEMARREAEVRRRETEARAAAEEVIRPLRLLGFSADEARRAATLCESIPDAPLEERVRRALAYFQPRRRTPAQAAASLGSAP